MNKLIKKNLYFSMLSSVLLSTAFMLAGCGQAGELYLPVSDKKLQITIKPKNELIKNEAPELSVKAH